MQWITFNTKCALFSCLACFLTVSHGPGVQAAAGSIELELFRQQSGSSCLPPASIASASSGSFQARSSVECAKNCVKDGDCLAHVFSSLQGACHILSDVTALTGSCGVSESTGWQTWVRTSKVQSMPSTTTAGPECQNGGEKTPVGLCKCFYGYVGTYCERLMQDCQEALQSGYYDLDALNPFLTAKPAASPHNMTVLCRGNGQTVILRQLSVHKGGLNRTWQEYLEGFNEGGPQLSHWMGLQNLYYLSNSKLYKLSLYVRLFDKHLFRITYRSFKVLDNTTFTAELGAFEKPAGYDLIGDLNFNPFSTYDHNHGNQHYANCALSRGGGWWFGSGCANSSYNLVGQMSTNYSGDAPPSSVFYGSQPGGTIRLLTFSLE